MKDSERERQAGRQGEGEGDTVSIMKCSHVRHRVLFFLLDFNTLSSTPITFAQLAEMKLVRVQSPMTGQHLHAWHVTDGKRLWQNKAHA